MWSRVRNQKNNLQSFPLRANIQPRRKGEIVMKNIIEINRDTRTTRKKLRVAAYCRVSTNLPEQGESFETQVRYYQALIDANPDWENAGIYADEGFSATSAAHRPEFQRLMKDADAGKIDLILTKSISRFARNAADCQTYTRKLKNQGVEVRFEREGISTMDSTTDFVLSILAAVAQEESHSISRNVRWQYEQNFKRGIYRMGNNRVLGFDMAEDGRLVLNQDAWIPKLIFTRYADGASLHAIAEELTARNAKRLYCDLSFDASTLLRILRNERYVGDMLLQKKAPLDYLTKKPQKNIAYKSYYIKNAHQGIISRKVWEQVQRKLAERAQQRMERKANKHEKNKPKKHVVYKPKKHVPNSRGVYFDLSGKVFCGYCGAPCVPKSLKCRDGRQITWSCGKGCRYYSVCEGQIYCEIAAALGNGAYSAAGCQKRVEKVIITDDSIKVLLKGT